ncbi:MAG TPA: 16S rRNA (cytidine(1402)-2'-O)-methyltransferase [Acidimicrobiales bacterium]|nr:16S rRNA (cytidine(1402)-2'-O)-methyltransferase [Acidimicrobiales bacterium]
MPESPSRGDNEVGELVLVATPLGNLGDITRRALEVLERADVVFCEDTRHSRTLFSAYAIATRHRLRALHEHNEASLCEEVVALVAAGQVIALVSDAGTPTISDPGTRVAAAVAAAGLRVTTTPGPSSVVAALSVSGLPSERFVVEGFLARRSGEREASYERWAREPRTIVFFESPQRLAATLGELGARFPERRIAVVRELTKLHEEIVRGTAREVAEAFASRDILGEIVVVLGGTPDAPADHSAVRTALLDHLARGASVRDASTTVANDLGVAHRDVYRMALALRDERDRAPDQ